MRVYLDNCCYNRPYDDQSQLKIHMESQAKLDIQQQIRDGRLELAASYILEAENSVNPFEMKRTDIQAFVDQHANVFIGINKDREVRKLASEIMRFGVKLMDACHVACAMLAGCEIFFSTDKRLLKYQTDKIRIINPVTFIIEQEAEK